MIAVLSRYTGFCEGVRRAVETAMSVPSENTFILGEIVHNEEVVRAVAERGIRTVESAERVPDSACLIIRSHGVGKELYSACARRNIRIVDCTCPFVRRIQRIVEERSAAGDTVVIIGKKEHPEVRGLLGWASGETLVFGSEEDDFSVLRGKNVSVVVQTTFSHKIFSEIEKKLQFACPKTLVIFPTICYTTVCRQKEAASLAKVCDAVIVIGGDNSSNTARLCEIASEHCGAVFHLGRVGDFKYDNIKIFERVGIIAGASTSDLQTQEVLFKMAENTEVQTENVAEEAPVTEAVAAPEEVEAAVAAEEAPAAEAVAEPVAEPAEVPAPDETPAEASAEMKAPESLMAKVVQDIDKNERYRKGQLITANIVSATDEGIFVSASGKLEILLAKEEIDCENYSREAYAARVGEEIRLMVVEVTPKVKLSEKAVRKIREEEELLKDIETGKEFSVVCTGFNKGGLTAELGSYPVFIPAREIRSGYVKDLEKYKGKTLRLRCLEIRKERRKEVIASQRVILEEERAAREAAKAEREAAFFDGIQVGDVVEGKVERVTSFGAFVSVSGFDCLAHISDLSWTGVKEVTDVLEIGKRYQFKVLRVDRENKKVSIGYKQLQPQPWELAAEKYAEGDVVHGKVVRIVPFGAFVEIEKGIDGLVHVSQISHEWLENPTSALQIGEEVDAKIIAFNPDEKKITLSIKALVPAPEYEPRHEREDRGDEKGNRRGRKNNRRGGGSDYEESDEFREWTEGGYSGASIADLLGNSGDDDDENK